MRVGSWAEPKADLLDCRWVGRKVALKAAMTVARMEVMWAGGWEWRRATRRVAQMEKQKVHQLVAVLVGSLADWKAVKLGCMMADETESRWVAMKG